MSLDFLRPSDFEIKKITTKEGDEVEIVQLKGGVAFDPSFIALMVSNGVFPKKEYKNEEEE